MFRNISLNHSTIVLHNQLLVFFNLHKKISFFSEFFIYFFTKTIRERPKYQFNYFDVFFNILCFRTFRSSIQHSTQFLNFKKSFALGKCFRKFISSVLYVSFLAYSMLFENFTCQIQFLYTLFHTWWCISIYLTFFIVLVLFFVKFFFICLQLFSFIFSLSLAFEILQWEKAFGQVSLITL